MSETIKDSAEFLKYKSKYLVKYTRWIKTQDDNLGMILPIEWVEYFDAVRTRLDKLYAR